MTKSRKFNPAWPSAIADRKSGRAAQSMRQTRQRRKEQRLAIEANTQHLGLTFEELLERLADGSLTVVIVE